MRPRVTSSVLWGTIGALSFLVLLQGYRLVGSQPLAVSLPATVGVALAVGLVAGVGSILLEDRLA